MMQHVPGYRPPARNAHELLQRLREPVGKVRFSQCKESGWLSGSSSAVSLCCDLYNNRDAVAKALALVEALQRNKSRAISAMVAGCDCLTKSPEPEHHGPDCLYRNIAQTLLE